MRRQLFSTSALLGFLVAAGAGKAQAQVARMIEADIPFAFHVGGAQLPPGQYVVKTLDDSDLNVMEIVNPDGHQAALFMVTRTQAETAAPRAELVFDKYQDQYFLSQLFDRGKKDGNEVVESHYEKLLKEGAARAEQRHLPVRSGASTTPGTGFYSGRHS